MSNAQTRQKAGDMNFVIAPVRPVYAWPECPECGEGRMVPHPTKKPRQARVSGPNMPPPPPVYPHVCDECGHEHEYVTPYPILTYEEIDEPYVKEGCDNDK